MVHIIPLSVGQRRLDTGSAVQYPQGSPIGGAMQGFGDHLSALAERYQQMKDQQDAFDAELARRGFDARIAQAEDDVAANAPADGAGMHEAMYGEVDLRAGRVVKTGLFDTLFDDAKRTMPESQRAAFAGQKENKRAVGAYRMALRQKTKRDDYEKTVVDTTLTTSASAIAKSDPNDTATFQAIRQSGLDLIAKIGNPLARQAAEAAWRTNSAKARMEALIAQNPRRAVEILSANPVASDGMGETVRAQLAAGAQDGRAAAKGDRIKKSPDRMVAQAFEESPTEANARPDADDSNQFIAGMTGEQIDELLRRASVAKTANMINTRADIEHATSNAPRELMYWGTYSGKLPGEGDFDHVYAAEEGARQRTSFIRKIKIGRAAFELLPLPNDALEAIAAEAQSDAENATQSGGQENIATLAAKQILQERRDPGRFLSLADPNTADAWNAWVNHTSGDSVALRRAVALSVAGQKQLHIPEILPFPQDVLRYINSRLNDPNASQKDKDALVDELSSATDDPAVQTAMFRQLHHFGLARLVHNTALELQMTPAEAQAVELEQAAKSGLQTKGQIWEYDPTLREKAGGFVAGEARPYGLRADLARALVGSTGLGNEGISAADVAPVIGGVFSSQEALRALEAGHYGEAALDAVGAIPSGGLGGKVGKKVVGQVAEEVFGKAAKDAVSLAKKEEQIASKSANIYDPESKPARSIFDDYKGAVQADDNEKLLIDARTGTQLSDPKTGRLLYDSERRRFGDGRVVGRSTVGGEDSALLPEEYAAIVKATIGESHKAVEKGSFQKGVVGKYVVTRGLNGAERSILILNTLSKDAADKVGAHEIGHMIDDIAGKIVRYDQAGPVRMIDQKGIKGELEWLYNDLNNPVLQRDRAAGRLVEQSSSKVYRGFGPEQMGYKTGIDADQELMAEAIRAYMANPNYMKTVAPKTAARIRAYVNGNRDLRDIIQFNSVVGVGGGGAGAAAVLGTRNDSATQGESGL